MTNDPLLLELPFPLAVVAVEGGRVQMHNAAFGAAFGAVATGEPLPAALAARGEAATASALAEALAGSAAEGAPRRAAVSMAGRWWEVTVTPVGAVAMVTARDTRVDRAAELVATVVSHDLRNALSPILTGAALLERRAGLADAQLAQLRRMTAGAERVARLVSLAADVLQANAPSGLTLTPAGTSLGSLASAALARLTPAHPGREVLVTTTGDTSGRWDPERVEQMAYELIANALVHGDATAPVEVELRGDDDAAELRVRSRGPLPPGAATLLDPLAARGARVRRKGGSGLSVYLAALVARAHGGDLTLTSDGTSTTATLRLPRATAVS